MRRPFSFRERPPFLLNTHKIVVVAVTSTCQQIDRYQIRRVLGTGAMGSVYAAWDPKLHREVALKVVPARLSGEGKGRERFHREARAIAAVRHPNIVEIYDYSGTDSEYLYLVIEKLDGEDLYAAMNRRGAMPEAVAAAVGYELCSALQVAHEAGIIHRDLKPENVFLNNSGRVVLTDFGIVKAVKGDSAVDGYRENTDVIGTPGFMAPELMSGRGLGPTIDIFALGALLYNITTKRLPYEGSSPLDIFQRAAAGKFEDPRKYNPLLSDELCAIIASCLQPNPKKRPRSADIVRQLLKTVLEDNGVTDVRDDLRDYMHNSEAYRAMAHQRTARHLVQQIKIAAKDRDTALAQRLRQRLLGLDPVNEDINEVSGVMTPLSRTGRQGGFGAASRRIPRWLYGACAALTLACSIAALSYSALSDSDPAPGGSTPGKTVAQLAATPVPPKRTPAPAAPRDGSGPGGAVEIHILGGQATVFVDDKPMGRISHKSVHMEPGRHEIEVVRRGRRLHKMVLVGNGSHIWLRADLARKAMSVQQANP